MSRQPGAIPANDCIGWFDPQGEHHECASPYAPIRDRGRCHRCYSKEQKTTGFVRWAAEAESAPPPQPQLPTPSPEKSDSCKIVTTLRFDPHLLADIDAAARKRGVSRTAWIMMAASKAVESGL